MKRLLGIILCVVFIFSSVGCSVQNTNDDANNNAETDAIVENTKNTDESSTVNDDTFAINEKYLSYMGKSKDFIDGECGDKGEFSTESGGVTYKNGLIVGFNTISVSEKPQSNNIATSLNIKLEDLFFNCPQTVTFEQIKSVFDEIFP